ncbi:MAG: MATE family efflux transporter [Hydrogeniiclostridium mannosilyticum]
MHPSWAPESRKRQNRLFGNVLRFLITAYFVTVALGLIFLPQLLGILGASSDYPGVYAITERYVRAQFVCVPIMFCQGPFYYFVHADGAPRRAAAALTVSNFVDIVLNYVFVIRLNMGAEGSVWSTQLVRHFALQSAENISSENMGCCGLTGRLLICMGFSAVCKPDFSSAVQYVYQFITVLCANTLLFSMGGPVGVAVFDVVYNLSQLFAAVADGTGMTMQPMISTYRAERDAPAVKRTLQLSAQYGSALALLVIAGLGLGAAPLCTLFGLSDASGKAGLLALRIYCISILPSLWNQIAIYYQQTTQRECSALVIQTLRLFVCFLAPMFALAPFGLNAFWWVFPLSELMTLCYVLFSSERHKASGRSAADPKASPVIRSFSAYIQDAGLLGGTVEQLQRTCEEWDCTSQQSYYATLVVEEVCAAILEDAKNNHRSDVLIKLTVLADQNGFTLHLRTIPTI